MFIGQTPTEVILYIILYVGATLMSLIASLYLYLRKNNVFASDITTPLPLRRWTAAFFAVVFLSHVWWFFFYIFSGDYKSVSCIVYALIDCILLLITIPGMLFAMLQDRKRRSWPVVLGAIPYCIFGILHIINPNDEYIDMAIGYILLFYVGFSIYLEYALRQYGRWLRDNFADLENKELWATQVMIAILLILVLADGFDSGNLAFSCVLQVIEIAFFVLLLWRVETLPLLEESSAAEQEQQPQQSMNLPSNIEELLEEHCAGTELYLQHDLTLQQLAQAVGINRFYLSQYFSRQGTTYNDYISDLRIKHFTKLYRKAAAEGLPITAQQLASDSGYRSYTTFSLAFKKRMGQSVSSWMRDTTE